MAERQDLGGGSSSGLPPAAVSPTSPSSSTSSDYSSVSSAVARQHLIVENGLLYSSEIDTWIPSPSDPSDVERARQTHDLLTLCLDGRLAATRLAIPSAPGTASAQSGARARVEGASSVASAGGSSSRSRGSSSSRGATSTSSSRERGAGATNPPPTKLEPFRVLDLGTGDGTWPVALSRAYGPPDPARLRVTGLDADPSALPALVPANVSFEVEDLARRGWGVDRARQWRADQLVGSQGPGGWARAADGAGVVAEERDLWRGAGVDFVHVRALAGGSVTDWVGFFEECLAVLKPGGSIEVTEIRTRWFDYNEAESDLGGEAATQDDPMAAMFGGPAPSPSSVGGEDAGRLPRARTGASSRSVSASTKGSSSRVRGGVAGPASSKGGVAAALLTAGQKGKGKEEEDEDPDGDEEEDNTLSALRARIENLRLGRFQPPPAVSVSRLPGPGPTAPPPPPPRRLGRACKEYTAIFQGLTQQAGVNLDPSPSIPRWLTAAGFDRVVERTELIPAGRWGTDEKMKRKGEMLVRLLGAGGLENYSMRLFTRFGYDDSAVREMIEQVKLELMDPTVRGYMTAVFITARKPKSPLKPIAADSG